MEEDVMVLLLVPNNSATVCATVSFKHLIIIYSHSKVNYITAVVVVQRIVHKNLTCPVYQLSCCSANI